MKSFDVCGLGNAIVDIFLELSDADFESLQLKRGSMTLVDNQQQQALLNRFHDGSHDMQLVSGGSVANSIIGLTQLGGEAAFIGCVGDDRYGLHYAEEFEQLKIDIGNPVLVGETTGTCLAMITPDAERTMCTCLAVASSLAARHVDAQRIAASEWLFIEGYVFANPETGQHAIREAIKVAKDNQTKIALTCSDDFIPQVFGDAFLSALAESDLLFCNAPESMSVTGQADSSSAFSKLRDMVPAAVVTDGPQGAFVRFDGQESHVPAFACTPKDLTGAGDMFAGAFLYGITHGVHPEKAARGANFLCHKVITQIGARLQHNVRKDWEAVVS
ncbi:MAG: adenosine kinase [Planctomycetales bacterium]|nr:adenosine kinase [Planctomycetales bacterium]